MVQASPHGGLPGIGHFGRWRASGGEPDRKADPCRCSVITETGEAGRAGRRGRRPGAMAGRAG